MHSQPLDPLSQPHPPPPNNPPPHPLPHPLPHPPPHNTSRIMIQRIPPHPLLLLQLGLSQPHPEAVKSLICFLQKDLFMLYHMGRACQGFHLFS